LGLQEVVSLHGMAGRGNYITWPWPLPFDQKRRHRLRLPALASLLHLRLPLAYL
jgi:hypothetical protein